MKKTSLPPATGECDTRLGCLDVAQTRRSGHLVCSDRGGRLAFPFPPPERESERERERESESKKSEEGSQAGKETDSHRHRRRRRQRDSRQCVCASRLASSPNRAASASACLSVGRESPCHPLHILSLIRLSPFDPWNQKEKETDSERETETQQQQQSPLKRSKRTALLSFLLFSLSPFNLTSRLSTDNQERRDET